MRDVSSRRMDAGRSKRRGNAGSGVVFVMWWTVDERRSFVQDYQAGMA